MRRWFHLLLIAVLAVSLAACGGGGTSGDQTDTGSTGGGEPAADQEFVIALETDVVQFDPIKIQDATTSSVAGQIFEQLLRRTPDGQLEPALAEDWESDETGQVWTFHLRRGVTFHDGSPFNAEVVKWHFERAMSDESNFAKQFSIIESIETPDEYTVIFRLKEPSAAFIDNTILTNGGFIPSKKAFEEKGEAFASEPVGTGPFRWHQWVQGQRVELVRNEDWWDEKPKLSKVVYRVIPEANTQVIELETGGVHLITRASREDLERLQNDGRFVVKVEPAYRNRYFMFNVTRPPFDDIRLRQAVIMAVDTKTIVESVAHPLTVPTDSLIPKASWAYAEGLKTYGYDPEKAVQLLEEAGYVKNADGVLVKDGKPLAITIHTPDGRYFMDKTITESVANQLRQLGFQVDIKVLEWAAFLEDVEARNFQMAFLGWNQSSPEPSLFTDALVMTGGRGNDGGYSDPELDEILRQAMRVTDQEERKALYAQAQQIVNDNAWFVWVGNEALVWIYPKNITGFDPTPARQTDYTKLQFTN